MTSATFERVDTLCAHCGQPVPTDRDDVYCCRGCRSVASLLSTSGLQRFYQLRGDRGVPVPEAPAVENERLWLTPLADAAAASDAPTRLELEVSGMHCSACVWLVEELFERRGTGAVCVNPALGRVSVTIDRAFPLADWVADIESFGYRVGPAREGGLDADTEEADGLLVRTGITMVLAGNGMMLAAAMHFGLAEGNVHAVARHVSFACAVLALMIGGPVFARGAFEGLRRRTLHLDVPIVLGLGLAFVGSTWAYLAGRPANYVDTLTVFVALMLLGRWLKTRVLARNRRELLRDPGLEHLVSRRVTDGVPTLVPCVDLRPDDVLLVGTAEVVPMRSVLLDEQASFSFDWIDGESAPRRLARGDEVPSGAVLVGREAVRLRATERFASSQVWSLVRGSGKADDDGRKLAGIPANFGGYYVAFVLVAAAVSFASGHLRAGGSLELGLELATAALVVTCPCAFGIAVPLAYEVVQASLRKLGVFVRRTALFDRALAVRELVFDKTGTLTTGRLRLADEAPLATLDTADRDRLYQLVARSTHPKSRAVESALSERHGARLREDVEVRELPGRGLEAEIDGHAVRVGSPGFAGAPAGTSADVVFSVDGVVLAALDTVEELRAETRRELARLARMGLTLHIASGDRQARCDALAAGLGFEDGHVHGDLSPDDKQALVESLGADRVMMLGDGLNDAHALATAACSGTPTVDRPFTASRCDFHFVTPGLEPVTQILHASRRLSQVVRTNLVLAIVYNLVAVALCIAGIMKPWLAALFMPASSLATLTYTVLALRGGDRRWTS